jgi:hypothetical protein
MQDDEAGEAVAMPRARTGCTEKLQSKDGRLYYRVRVLAITFDWPA